ncbi:MAG: hypothetical protein HY921_02130 [Elusimicrobia bacterium]|nr:hypothetical protein [Elusimicrobiota bacterium]
MRRLARFLVAAGVLSAAAVPARAAFQVRVDASYAASLFYLLDNLSGAQPLETSAYYREFWKEKFGLDAEDEAFLARYAALRKAHDRDSDEKWPLMFIGASSVAQARERAAAALEAEEAQDLFQALAHFGRKFQPLWESRSGHLTQAVADFSKGGWDVRIEEYLAGVSRFFELDPALSRDFKIALLWHPGLKASAGHSHAVRKGTVMLVELPEDLRLLDQIDVIVHECVHDLFAAIPEKARAGLAKELFKIDRRAGLFFLQDMNEGLATALGQGLFLFRHVPEKFKADGNWYSTSVDAFAKSVFPEVRRAMDESGTLSSRAPRWAAAVRALAAQAKLCRYFRNQVLLTDPGTMELAEPLFQAMDISNAVQLRVADAAAERESVRRAVLKDSLRPVVVMLSPASLESLREALDWSLRSEQVGRLVGLSSGGPLAVISWSDAGRPYLLLLGEPGALKAGFAALPRLDFSSEAMAVRLRDGSRLLVHY